MTTRPVRLPGPLAIVLSNPKALAQLGQPPLQFVAQLAQLSAAGALPARVDPAKGQLIVYTERLVAGLYVTQRGDAYRLGYVSSRTFGHDGRLLDGALQLRCSAWHPYQDVQYLPRAPNGGPAFSSYWNEICHAWAALAAGSGEQPHARLAPHHEAYLELLTRTVEASRDIEIAKQSTAPPLRYRSVRPAREERHTARGVYAFALARPTDLAAGAMVHIGDQPDLRGRVTRNTARELNVRFEPNVDFRQIPPQGSLRSLPSDRVYRAQLAAIQTLHDRKAANPHLLNCLVDNQFQPYKSDASAQPRETLHDAQRKAFTRALSVPDMLLVLGPPGTGKTRTIVQIATACATRGQRVLVTSHTNRAVDNVLEKLPPDVFTVRVGNEDSMTATARSLMVETRSEDTRKDILANTAALAAALAGFDTEHNLVARWTAHLDTQLAGAQDAQTKMDTASTDLDAAIRRASKLLNSQLHAAERDLARQRANADTVQRRIARARDRLARVQGRAGILALLNRWLSTHRTRRLESLRQALAQAQAAAGQAEQRHAEVWTQVSTLAGTDPEVARLMKARDAAQATASAARSEADRAANLIRDCLRAMVDVPDHNPTDAAGWGRFLQWARQAEMTVGARAALLSQWRAQIDDADVQLQRELVRYADVVVATCVGTATTALLAGIDFDLAIVDEAGQISTANLLVPLVRARRAVLVGDHKQLPPFLDEDVRQWAAGLSNAHTDEALPSDAAERIGELLRASAFERLYPRARADNRRTLTLQHRMPEILGQFVSDNFYDKVLRTQHPGVPGDPVFTSPFAMVDTSDRTASERAEQAVGSSEAWRQGGYINDLEAELITALVSRYRDWYQTWAVIVPYRAQAERITTRLATAIGNTTDVADNVGTVDSFQGGERDLIIYGFTRSNSSCDIGFLKELRRINVAITRARQQLVLVGDTETLGAARNREFAELMRKLTAYLKQSGDLRPSRSVETVLRQQMDRRP